MDLYETVIRNRDVCVIAALRSIELHSERAALRVQGEGVKVTERLQRHNCGQVCAFPERGRGLSLFRCLSLLEAFSFLCAKQSYMHFRHFCLDHIASNHIIL